MALQACGRFIDANDRRTGELSCKLAAAFACAAKRIKDYRAWAFGEPRTGLLKRVDIVIRVGLLLSWGEGQIGC